MSAILCATVRHLRRLYRDPMTGETEWGLVKDPDGGIYGVYSLSADKPFKRAGYPALYSHFDAARSYRDWTFSFDVAQAEQVARQAGRRAR